MARFLVKMTRTTVATVDTLKIEAESEEQAKEIAREMAEEDSINWDNDGEDTGDYDFTVTMDNEAA